MFCRRCGKELKEGARFCTGCGCEQTFIPALEQVSKPEPVAPAGQPEEEAVETSSNKILVIILAVLSVVLAGCIVAGIFIFTGTRFQDTVSVSDSQEGKKGKKKTKGEEVEEATAEDTGVQQEEAAEGSIAEGTLLVCAPADYMSLRSTPGLGDDIIDNLYAGTYLDWSGVSRIVNETEFYQVKVVDSGKEGYVSADYCIEVGYFSDESKLGVVETDSTVYTFEMMQEDILTLCTDYPDRLTYNVLGTSIDGRELYEVVLGNPNAEQHIMLQASIHGREYMNTQLVMRMLEYYAVYYDEADYMGTSYRELFEKTAFHVVPMANPDGVTISQLGVTGLNNFAYGNYIYECYERDKATLVMETDSYGEPNWVDYYKDSKFSRKPGEREITFEEYQSIWKANVMGTDLNNNFDAGWDTIDLKSMPAYSGFKGHYPVSEPETFALQELALSRDFLCFISYHSRGQLIYYDVNGNSTANSARSEKFANFMESAIKYQPSNTQRAYGVNLGGFGDWIQLSLDKPSVTIESGKGICPLELKEFKGMWLRHKESWAKLAYEYY